VALEQVVSADQKNRGWVLIKETGTLITSFWFADVMSIHRSETDGMTQIMLRDPQGLWYRTSATPDEVHYAISTAAVLFDSSTSRKKRPS
jgi:hypothetical protein